MGYEMDFDDVLIVDPHKKAVKGRCIGKKGVKRQFNGLEEVFK